MVIAFAGDVKQEGVINEYFKGERKELPKFKRGTSFELLVVENKSVYWCQNNLFLQLMENSYYAIGNGWECAMAAMQCGKSAAEAVIVASKLNVYTNDIIDTYNIKTKKLTLSPFPK